MVHLRQVVRTFGRKPAVAITAIATLALGVALTTTMFTVVDAVLLEPLPFPGSDRLVALYETNSGSGVRDEVSALNFADWQERSRLVESMTIGILESPSFVSSTVPERITSVRASTTFFDVFGVAPMIGRGFAKNEDQPGRGAVAVISHAFWQSQFQGDPAILGRTMRLDAQPHTVIGVMPPSFSYPDSDVAVWRPLVLRDYELKYREKRMFSAVARLRPGVSEPQAAAELKAIAAALEREHPRENSKWTISLAPMREELVAFQKPLLLLLAASVLVLLLASANVANLLLARAASRSAEIVVRSALGATRGDLVRQFLTESAILAAAGTVLGVLVAQPLITFIATRRPASLPLWTDLALDGRVLAASAAAMVLSTLVAGLIPALAGSRHMDLAQLRTRSTAPRHSGMLRRLLAGGQVMLAVILLVCATMLVRSLMALYDVNPGFATENRVGAVLELPDSQYDRTRELTLFASFLERVRSLPGVESAGAVTALPLHGFGVNYASEVYVEGAPAAPVAPEADIRLASPAYFSTMGIRFVAGRDFASSDDARAPKVAIVNQEFVRALAGGRDPIGRGAKLYCEKCPEFRIVGIVRNTRHHGLNAPLSPEIYVPYTQNPHGELTIVAKVTGNPQTVVLAMRKELVGLDPDLALAHVATLEEIVARSAGQTRFSAMLLAAFSGCALLLAAIGIYGSLSFSISQRQRDIAIRVAVGADRQRVWRLVFAEATRPVVWGVLAGSLASVGAAQAIRSMMFGVSPVDPVSYGLVIATFALVVFVVAAIGFRRATATDVRMLLADA